MHTWTATAAPDYHADGQAPTVADAWNDAHLAAEQLVHAGGRYPVTLCVDDDIVARLNGPETMAGDEIAAWIEQDREEIVAIYRGAE